ncbi:ribosomal L7Ae/L30e/S12e/Gadd45 family protein [Paenibacillus tarimensis]|uniref:ribosomal L7Ae/L30e/S12e/Gadd45 family protein n=1 Tax=Paenibacillus tarimensis TaxID=416012 RepID=UPI001F1601E3|nr:ribosomal L7Ae/L30e/S12e/Gadd45 family protein [Paenibacillus tarimensis]MCF2946143.1 ribosomal L7Ae/L30e/S12e/Gadd45 family protein [Paenibacillus tarimensis]
MPYKIGTKQTTRMVEQQIAERVLVAKDADPRITGRIIDLCAEAGVEIVWVESMEILGETCGIDVGAAMAAMIPDE